MGTLFLGSKKKKKLTPEDLVVLGHISSSMGGHRYFDGPFSALIHIYIYLCPRILYITKDFIYHDETV